MASAKNNYCTIYILKNTINNKIYVGQTWTDCKDRMGRGGYGYTNSIYLFNAIRHYGCDKFVYDVVTTCTRQKDADLIESFYIMALDSKNPDIGYNIKDGGSVGKHSEETKFKISTSLTGRTHTEEAKKNMSIAQTGIPKPKNDAWREQNSVMMINRHATQGHPMAGKHHTEEVKLKIGAASKGRKHSEESVAIRAKKRQMDPAREAEIVRLYMAGETITKIQALTNSKTSAIYRVIDRNKLPLRGASASWQGKKHTEETKAKMKENMKKAWEQRKLNKLNGDSK